MFHTRFSFIFLLYTSLLTQIMLISFSVRFCFESKREGYVFFRSVSFTLLAANARNDIDWGWGWVRWINSIFLVFSLRAAHVACLPFANTGKWENRWLPFRLAFWRQGSAVLLSGRESYGSELLNGWLPVWCIIFGVSLKVGNSFF